MAERKWRIRDLFLWPVKTPNLAKRSVLPCFIFACVYAFIWTAIAIIGISYHTKNGDILNILMAILWILITWGLHKMSPVVAIVGFIMFLWGTLTDANSYRSEIRDFIMLFLYIQAIRGTHAYQDFQNELTHITNA